MSLKFKPGDKVRFNGNLPNWFLLRHANSNRSPWSPIAKGEVLTIRTTNLNESIPFYGIEEHGYCIYEEQVEKITLIKMRRKK